MISLLGIKGIMYAVAAVAVVGAASAMVYHYKSLVQERAELASRASLAETELEHQKEVARRYRVSMDEQLDRLRKNLQELNSRFANEKRRRQEIGKLFSRHDLSRLAQKKPGLVGNRINVGTARLWFDLEQATRSHQGRDSSGSDDGVPKT